MPTHIIFVIFNFHSCCVVVAWVVVYCHLFHVQHGELAIRSVNNTKSPSIKSNLDPLNKRRQHKRRLYAFSHVYYLKTNYRTSSYTTYQTYKGIHACMNFNTGN